MLRKDLKKPAFKAPDVTASTADPAEIERFNALADEWWRPDGAFKVVHAFNAARVKHLSDRLPALLGRDPASERPLKGIKLLDVGCAAGLVSEPMSVIGADVLGIDASERNVLVARRHAEASGADIVYRHALPEDLVAGGETFDVVMSLEVVEHVADVGTFLRAIGNLVAPGGLLVVGTINRTALSFVKAIIGAEYILRWLPKGTHQWSKFVTPLELDAALSRQGFRVEESCGVSLNPFTMAWHISGRKDSTYLQFHCRSR